MAKIYVKRGAPNAKESKLVYQIQRAIDAQKAKDPSFVFDKTCRTYEELKQLHKEMCTEEIPYEEVLDFGDKKEKVTSEKIEEVNAVSESEAFTDDDNGSFVDPFNRANPVVRDYVLDDKMSKNGGEEIKTGSAYSEPVSFDEAFSLPEEDEDAPATKSSSGKKSTKPKKPRSRKEAPEPINPDFSNMTAAKQKKNTKLFAKFIVEAVCTIAEKGFVWYATMDINEAKLVEYEVSGEMDLSLLLTMEDGQKVTVKNWFSMQNFSAIELSEIEQEDRDDLADALAEVLLEKGFAPSPTQVLLMKIGHVFLIQKGLALLQHKMQTNSVLAQLRAMANPSGSQLQEEIQQEQQEPLSQEEREYVKEDGEPEEQKINENDGATTETE